MYGIIIISMGVSMKDTPARAARLVQPFLLVHLSRCLQMFPVYIYRVYAMFADELIHRPKILTSFPNFFPWKKWPNLPPQNGPRFWGWNTPFPATFCWWSSSFYSFFLIFPNSPCDCQGAWCAPTETPKESAVACPSHRSDWPTPWWWTYSCQTSIALCRGALCDGRWW